MPDETSEADDIAEIETILATARTAAGNGAREQALSILRDARVNHPAHAGLELEAAQLAQGLGKWQDAVEHWAAVHALSPDEPAYFAHAPRALTEVGMLDDAETLAREAQARLPNHDEVFFQYARIAERRGDQTEAIQRWAAAREAFPNHWFAYVAPASHLRDLGRFDEAEALLREAQTVNPTEPMVLVAHAQLAMAQRDWDTAISRWQSAREQFPHLWFTYTGAAAAYREKGWWDESEALLRDMQSRFGQEVAGFVEYAVVAEARGDWQEAAARWQVAQEKAPDSWHWVGRGAVALRESGQLDAADDLLRDAQERFPTEPGRFIEYARVAERRPDWQEAAARWEATHTRFPNLAEGWYGHLRALIHLQRQDESEPVLRAALEHLPGDEGMVRDYAFAAHRRQDWATAIERWAQLRDRFPTAQAGYLLGAAALRETGHDSESDALIAAGIEQCKDRRDLLFESARLAQESNDLTLALRRWATAREQYPGFMALWLRHARALHQAGHAEEAEALLEQATTQFPDALEPAQEHAELAFDRRDFDLASERFAVIRQRSPHDPQGYLGAAFVEIQRAQIYAADEILAQGERHVPDNPRVALLRAQLWSHPHANPRNLDEAIRRIEQVAARFPEFAGAVLVLSQTYREAGRLEDAERVITDGRQRFPQETGIALEQGLVAIDRMDWPAAVARFKAAIDAFPGTVAAHAGLVNALARSGDFVAAEAVATDTIERFSNNPAAYLEYGQIAIRQNDFQTALHRLNDALTRFPDNAALTERVSETKLRLSETVSLIEGTETAANVDRDATADRELVVQFESLGGSGHGSEFGFFQRRFGGEPLGLLRWSDLGDTPGGLIAALDSDFAGIGDPAQTQLDLVPHDERQEYWTTDRRYGMTMPAFVYADEVPREEMFVETCRRLQFLRDKLVQDLKEGGKIFVYKNEFRPLTDDELQRLHRAIRRHGSSWLLYICLSDADHPAGSVGVAAPGLMVGSVAHFSHSRADEPTGDADAPFLDICREAYRLWKAAPDLIDETTAPPPQVEAMPVQTPPITAPVEKPAAKRKKKSIWRSLFD